MKSLMFSFFGQFFFVKDGNWYLVDSNHGSANKTGLLKGEDGNYLMKDGGALE